MTPLVRLGIAVGAAALAGALFVLEHDNPAFSTARLTLVVLVGLVMVAAGIVASFNGEHRIGVLAVLGGYAWLGERCLQATPTDLTVTAGAVLIGGWFAFLAHALVTFPSGRFGSRVEGVVVVAGYVINFGFNLVILLFIPFEVHGLQQRNLLAFFDNAEIGLALRERADELTLVWVLALLAVIIVKASTASPAARRAYGAAWFAGGVLAVNGIVIVSAGLQIFDFRQAYDLWLEIVAGSASATLAATLFAIRVSEDRLVGLVADLETVGPGATLRGALRRALSDPGLDIVYLRAGTGGWIDEVGQAMTQPVGVGDRAVSPIERGGKPIAALVHDPVLLRNPERLRAAIGAAALAIDNEQLKAELRAQLLDVRASRARIVEAGDRERRRVERNLHDGAQQRLVGLALTLRLAERRAGGDPALTELLEEAGRELDDALSELRALSRGIHPAIVSDSGLGVALETLAERPGVPVVLEVDLPASLPEFVEVGVYYVVSEALANATKHAGATEARVQAEVVDGVLRVAVSDDGRGGAAVAPGSGLEGLVDRVAALGGRLEIRSPVGEGTSLSAEIPITAAGGAQRDPYRLAALKWVGWESFELPGEAYEQLTDEDNLTYAKAMYACAGGADRITAAERAWAVGYHAAAGDADWVLEALRTYDVADSLEKLMRLPSMTSTARAVVYDTLRMCSADGPLTADESARVREAAGRIGVRSEVVADLEALVFEEQAFRRRRYEQITAPVLPTASARL